MILWLAYFLLIILSGGIPYVWVLPIDLIIGRLLNKNLMINMLSSERISIVIWGSMVLTVIVVVVVEVVEVEAIILWHMVVLERC